MCDCEQTGLVVMSHGVMSRTCECIESMSVNARFPITWRLFANPYFGGVVACVTNDTV